jgi:hypothetical protein
MANGEKGGSRIGELVAMLQDPARRSEAMEGLARFEANLDKLMPWDEGSGPGYDRAALFSGGCDQWLVTKEYCEGRAALSMDEGTATTWLERIDGCQTEYENCVAGQ